MKGLLFYFSGTGNSKYIAEKFTQTMKADFNTDFQNISIENINSSNQNEVEIKVKNADIIGFCYPIYGSCVPRIMREFISKNVKLFNNKKIVIFCTQLMFSGDGARAVTDELKNINYQVIYANHISMPNNIPGLPVLVITNGTKNNKYLKKAKKIINHACSSITSNQIYKKGFSKFSIFLGLRQRKGFIKTDQTAKDKVTINDQKCTRCSLCVKKCPMDNLALKDNKIITNANCTLCFRCVNICPQKAINALLNNEIKVQYKGV